MHEHWYCIRSKPSQERIALENLKRQQFQAYNPQIQIERIKNGKVTRETESLFPGYLFVYFCLEPHAWRAINGSRGVLKLLSFSEDGKPSAVPNGQIELIQDQERKGQFRFSEIQRFRKGDLIKVKNGISVGLSGKVIRTRGERVEFLLSLLGRKVRCISPSHMLHLVAQGPVR